MAKRSIEVVVPPRAPHYVGDGFRVHNFIPSGYRLDMERVSPFIMLDYNSKYHFPPSEVPRGVDVHPHRGFETVTIAYHGRIAHHDSAGNSGVIGEGDVQWMTAASGVLHKEYHDQSFSETGGWFQMVQLWVNLPAKDKMSPPKYQELTNAAISKYYLPDEKGLVEVIAGEYAGIKGRAETFTPIHMLNVKVKKGAQLDFTFPSHYNTVALVIEGAIALNGQSVPTDHLALFDNDGTDFSLEATEDTTVLVVSGEPILEPIAAHGPFVMNTGAEIAQAFRDYHAGKFGYLD